MSTGLGQIFPPNLIFTVEGRIDRDSLFDLVADKLAQAGVIRSENRSAVIDRLKAREKTASTGIGKAVALPHIVVPELKNVTGVVVRVPGGIDWGAIDNQEVKLVVFLLAGEGPGGERVPEYLATLAEVARVLDDDERRNQIFGARQPQKIWEILARGVVSASFFVRHRKGIWFATGMAIACLASWFFMSSVEVPPSVEGFARFNAPAWIGRQVLATTIFFSMVLGTLFFFEYRVAIGAVAVATLLLVGVEDVKTATEAMSLPTILFIMGTMVIVRWLENRGFFRFLVTAAISRFGGRPYALTGALMLFSALLAGLVGEVSAILVTLQIAVEIARARRTSVVPYLLSLVFATNIGSALTMIGNPIGIYLAFAANLTFMDFLKYATPVALVVAVVLTSLLLYFYRRTFGGKGGDLSKLGQAEQSGDSKGVLLPSLVFTLFVLLVACHTMLENALGLPKQTTLLVAPLVVVGLIIFLEKEKGRFLIERAPDWWTILYFMFLFAAAACLEATGVTAKLARCVYVASEKLPLSGLGEWGKTANAILIILWGSALLSGFIDNLPIVVALAPVVSALAGGGLPGSHLLWWALLLGGCFGGNLTMIGSTANLVAVGMYERQFRAKLFFKDWIRVGAVVTLISLVIASVCLMLMLAVAR